MRLSKFFLTALLAAVAGTAIDTTTSALEMGVAAFRGRSARK